MTREEYLLVIIAEECSEIAKNAAKALRFGLNNCEPGKKDTNATRLLTKMVDLLALFKILEKENILFDEERDRIEPLLETFMENKIYKVEKFLQYSVRHGRLTE